MTQPAMPQQILVAQATGLSLTEKAFPLGAPPIPIAQGLLSIASALPQTGLPIPGTTGLPFPAIAGLPPLGGTPILANLAPMANGPLPRFGSRIPLITPYGRTGVS